MVETALDDIGLVKKINAWLADIKAKRCTAKMVENTLSRWHSQSLITDAQYDWAVKEIN